MLRRDKADELYRIVLKRYQKEKPNVKMTNQIMDSIWYSIYGVICREGEEAAKKYVESIELLDRVQ